MPIVNAKISKLCFFIYISTLIERRGADNIPL